MNSGAPPVRRSSGEPKNGAKADVTFEMSEDDFIALINKKANPQQVTPKSVNLRMLTLALVCVCCPSCLWAAR